MYFLQQFPHRGGYVLLFPVFGTISRFPSFCMEICASRGGENLFLCSLGEGAYSYRAALFARPAPPFIGGHPPLPRPLRPGFLPIKKIAPGPASMPSSSPAGFPASFLPAACFPAACFPALPHPRTPSISLNTYLVKHDFTLHRPFVVLLGCSATFFYPRRSSSRL